MHQLKVRRMEVEMYFLGLIFPYTYLPYDQVWHYHHCRRPIDIFFRRIYTLERIMSLFVIASAVDTVRFSIRSCNDGVQWRDDRAATDPRRLGGEPRPSRVRVHD